MPNELSKGSDNGVGAVAYRGEGNSLLAMELDEGLRSDDFVGFALEVKYPGSSKWYAVTNRLSFSYAPDETGARKFSSLDSPFQKFRWVHFPKDVGNGDFAYRIRPSYMSKTGKVSQKPGLELKADLSPISIGDELNVGFTRGFVSSQAYVSSPVFKGDRNILPKPLPKGTIGCNELPFDVNPYQEHYAWLGFEARRLLLSFLNECANDSDITVDLLAYELKEPTVLGLLEQLGPRLRAIIDDHAEQGDAKSCESMGAKRIAKSAGAHNVKRMHFKSQQHNKVLIARKGGKAFRVLTGSTNFSLRGLYIQANNLLDFSDTDVAKLYGRLFDAYWDDASGFTTTRLSTEWHDINSAKAGTLGFCFAPHKENDVSLGRVANAIRDADSSVMFAVAFLYQSGGAVREALDAATASGLFTYGCSDSDGDLELLKPDGSKGIVSFAYLAKHVPKPFQVEWAGGSGRHIHHKFVVCDFNGENPVVFTGSSNLSPNGESKNGDNLIMIRNRRVVTAYAIEAVRLFDHFQFRVALKEKDEAKSKAKSKKKVENADEELRLRKPPEAGEKTWFASSYEAGSPKEKDRELFTRPLHT